MMAKICDRKRTRRADATWHLVSAYGVGLISGSGLQPAGSISRALSIKLRAGSCQPSHQQSSGRHGGPGNILCRCSQPGFTGSSNHSLTNARARAGTVSVHGRSDVPRVLRRPWAMFHRSLREGERDLAPA